jgi:regulator of sigma E protease
MNEGSKKENFVYPWRILILGISFFAATRFVPFPVVAAFAVTVSLLLGHELSHWLSGRAFGMPTPLFSIGFGTKPRLLLGRLWKTDLQVTPWLFGGFAAVIDDGFAYWKRAIVILAGVAFNAILPVVVIFVMYAFIGIPVSKVAVGNLSSSVTIARDAGLKQGDLIISVDGQRVVEAADVERLIGAHKQSTVTVAVRRGHSHLQISLMPDKDGQVGVRAIKKTIYVNQSLGESFHRTIQINQWVVRLIVQPLQTALHISKPSSDLPANENRVSGPVGVVEGGAKEYVVFGPYIFVVVFVSFFSWCLAIGNTIIPIPACDGCKLVLLTWDTIGEKTGWWRPIPKTTRRKVAWIAFGIVLALSLFIGYYDLKHPVH